MTLFNGSFLTSVPLTWGSSDGLGTQKPDPNPKKNCKPKDAKSMYFFTQK